MERLVKPKRVPDSNKGNTGGTAEVAQHLADKGLQLYLIYRARGG